MLILLCLLSMMPLGASEPSQWEIHEVQVEDGLPDSTVFSIAQDAFGFLWFGTTSGVARYDGTRFRTLRHIAGDPSTLSSNNAGNLMVDSDNRLWIGTFGGGLNVLDLMTGELIKYPTSAEHPDHVSENVQTLFEDRDRNIWVGTSTGLFRIALDEQVTYFGHEEDDDNSLSHPRIWDILQSPDGSIWAGTSDGLNRLHADGRIERFALPEQMRDEASHDEFRSLYLDRDGVVWIGASTGLFEFDPVSTTFMAHQPDDVLVKVNRIRSVEPGLLLVATNNGLYELVLSSRQFNRRVDGTIWHELPDRDIRDIHVDRGGLLWLSTRYSGILKIDRSGNPIEHYNQYLTQSPDALRYRRVWSISDDTAGGLYLGTAGGVLHKTADNDYHVIPTDRAETVPGVVRSMHRAREGGLWIGSTSGLYYLADGSDQAHAVTEPFDQVQMAATNIYAIEETRQGALWLGLFNYGVLYWNPATGEARLIDRWEGGPLTYLNVRAVFEDSLGDIWIGTSLGGLFRYQPELDRITSYVHDPDNSDSIAANRVRTIEEDRAGRLWIATFKGLDQFDRETGRFSHITTADGLLSNSIQSIVEDSQQILWIGTQFGISRLDARSGDILNFGASFGIQNQGLNARSAMIDRQDLLYFGSVNGYYRFAPDHVAYVNPFNPQLAITEILIDNQPLKIGAITSVMQRFEIDHTVNEVLIRFAALDYKSPDQNRYLYRLSRRGESAEWKDASKDQQLLLNQLSPGEYRLEIKGSNSDGRWSEHQIDLPLVIHPAWWDRLWVKVLIGVGVVVLVLLIHLYRNHQILQRNRELERIVASRTADLQRLNAQLEATASTDYLTGLPNRMAFINSFRSKRQLASDGMNLSIVLADIDHFKQINDQYGHEGGDRVLIKVSDLFQSMIRQQDMVARWGGEEFIFCLLHADLEGAGRTTERIRDAMQHSRVIIGDTPVTITATFGICQYQDYMSLEECIHLADESLYAGKAGGRNTVVINRQDPETV